MRKKIVNRPIIQLWHIAFALILMGIFTVIFQQTTLKMELLNKKEILEKEVIVLEGETRALKEELANSNSLEFIERVARDDYGMVKPGEIVYIDLNSEKK